MRPAPHRGAVLAALSADKAPGEAPPAAEVPAIPYGNVGAAEKRKGLCIIAVV